VETSRLLWVADPGLRTSPHRAAQTRDFDGRGKAEAVTLREHRRWQQAVGRIPTLLICAKVALPFKTATLQAVKALLLVIR